MSSESDPLIVKGKEKLEEIQLASTSNHEVVIRVTEDEQLLDELEAVKINIFETKVKNVTSMKQVKIQKVPEIMLRNADYKEYFQPRELSIGPIYAVDPNLYKKELKLKLAASFIESSGRTAAFLLEKIKSEIKDLKMCFTEEVLNSYTDDALFRLVFLDGCAILQFVRSYVNWSLNSFNISNAQAALIQQDLFLLENQIPFKVLDVLMHYSKQDELPRTANLKDDFTKFIIRSSIIVPNHSVDHVRIQYELFGTSTSIPKPDHILDLYRRFLLRKTSHDSHHCCKGLLFLTCCTFFCIFIALGFLICCVVEWLSSGSQELPEYWSNMQSFRNVQELKTAGIVFKKTDTLRNIDFSNIFYLRGQLFLPTLVYKLLYDEYIVESDLPMRTIYDVDAPWVTSYVSLLDLFIDNEQDVKDLRAADIIRNCLSSDDEVAQLINSVGSNCFAPRPNDTYLMVKSHIELQHRLKCSIWMAQVCHTHCSSPLTVFAVIAGTVMLGLTVIQTYYTVYPKKVKQLWSCTFSLTSVAKSGIDLADSLHLSASLLNGSLPSLTIRFKDFLGRCIRTFL